jgi:hypothetical protein
VESKPTIKPRKNIVTKISLSIIIGAVIFANAWMAVQYHFDFATSNSLSGVLVDVKGIPSQRTYQIAHWQQNRIYSKELNQPVLPNYNNSDDNAQIIQAGENTAPISEEELPSLLGGTILPIVKGEFPKPTILLPFKLTNGEKVEVETYWTDSYNPINPDLSGEPLASGKNFIISKKGTEIIVPVEGASISTGTDIIQNKSYVTDIVIIFNGPDGTKYNLVITTPEDARQLSPSDLIKNAVASNNGTIADIAAGTIIATTSDDSVKVNMWLFVYPPPDYQTSLTCGFDLVEKNENGENVMAFVPQNTP